MDAGKYLHALMHTLEEHGIAENQLNTALNAILTGIALAVLYSEAAEKLSDDVEAMCPGFHPGLNTLLSDIVDGVEHPDKWGCQRAADGPEVPTLDRVLSYLAHLAGRHAPSHEPPGAG